MTDTNLVLRLSPKGNIMNDDGCCVCAVLPAMASVCPRSDRKKARDRRGERERSLALYRESEKQRERSVCGDARGGVAGGRRGKSG